MELVNRMKKRLIEVKESHNALIRTLNKTRILKNLKEYEHLKKSPINKYTLGLFRYAKYGKTLEIDTTRPRNFV